MVKEYGDKKIATFGNLEYDCLNNYVIIKGFCGLDNILFCGCISFMKIRKKYRLFVGA